MMHFAACRAIVYNFMKALPVFSCTFGLTLDIGNESLVSDVHGKGRIFGDARPSESIGLGVPPCCGVRSKGDHLIVNNGIQRKNHSIPTARHAI